VDDERGVVGTNGDLFFGGTRGGRVATAVLPFGNWSVREECLALALQFEGEVYGICGGRSMHRGGAQADVTAAAVAREREFAHVNVR
jgi:hypothetical protein